MMLKDTFPRQMFSTLIATIRPAFIDEESFFIVLEINGDEVKAKAVKRLVTTTSPVDTGSTTTSNTATIVTTTVGTATKKRGK